MLADRVLSGQLSQRKVAEATGVHQSQVSRILAGEARRASKNVLRLCKFAEGLQPYAGRATVDRKVTEMLATYLGCPPGEEAAVAELVDALRRWRGTWGRHERPA
jgi:transcriptional regulator with XRE-family HTH domain